jgi:hypothetical protein
MEMPLTMSITILVIALLALAGIGIENSLLRKRASR